MRVEGQGDGFTAAKFDPFPGPWRTFVDRRDEDFAIDHVRAMREALGPDFELLIEAHRRFAPSHAIRIGHRLAEFGVDWYEEPCLAENIDLVAEVRRAVPIPIVTGEALHTKEAFFECLAKRAADILNPDICVVGGITAMLDIAAMAQPQAVVMAPHNYNSTLMGLAATVHLSAVIPNFRIAEYFVNFQDLCRDISTLSLAVEGGWIDLPTAPGSRRRHRYRQIAGASAPGGDGPWFSPILGGISAQRLHAWPARITTRSGGADRVDARGTGSQEGRTGPRAPEKPEALFDRGSLLGAAGRVPLLAGGVVHFRRRVPSAQAPRLAGRDRARPRSSSGFFTSCGNPPCGSGLST